MRTRRRVIGVMSAAVVLVLVAVAADLAVAIGSVDRVAADPTEARSLLGLPDAAPELSTPKWSDPNRPGPDRGSTPVAAPGVYLVVGSDARLGLDGARADVLMLGLLPQRTTERPALVSLPRDLWVDDLCNGGRQRLNAALNGCGEITGAQLLGATVEHVTGLRVDHYVEIDLAGFEAVVEAIGGVEVCTELPTRDRRSGLDLPGGCLVPSPEQTLAWVRGRHLEEFHAGRWRPVAGSSDLLRNRHQQQVVLEMLGSLAELRSPLRLRGVMTRLMDHATLSQGLGVDDLLNLAWTWRQVDPDAVLRPTIDVVGRTTPGGAQVLDPADDLRDQFARILADLAVGAES